MEFKFTAITNPPGKLAEVEVFFTGSEPLAGLKLVGFSIWERHSDPVTRNVTMPARSYSVNGERRSFALLRPVSDVRAQDAIRTAILEAFAQWEAAQAVAS